MTVENDDKPADDAPPPHPRFTAADARQKAEFILSRAFGLLRDPKSEWEQIRTEQTTIPNITLGYVMPLAAAFSLCGLIGSYAFMSIRPALDQALIGAVVTFLAMTALVFLLGIMINAVAENFDADRNDLAAQKVAAYSMTPFFLSGIFWLWPPLWWLTFVAIAMSVFLLYRGLPALMKAPADRAVGYTTTVGIAGFVAFIIVFAVSGCVTGAGRL